MKVPPITYGATAASVALSGSSLSCNVTDIAFNLPTGQTQLFAPNASLSFVSLGVGVQNYTCSNTSSTWTNIGAVAEVFDISCLYNTPLFDTIPNITYATWNATPAVTPLELISVLAGDPIVLGQHYFVPNPNTTAGGVLAKFDFTSARFKGNANAYAIAARAGDLPAPTSRADIDWLELKAVQGELASVVYRVRTRGGQPPSSCTPGDAPISVKYTAQYWLFGSSLAH